MSVAKVAVARVARARKAAALLPEINGTTFYRDFRYGLNDHGWGPQVGLSRASEGLYEDASGVWQKAAASTARWNTVDGLLVELTATNKVTVYNAPGSGSPTTGYGVTGTASVSVVLDDTALATLVATDICTYAIDMQGGGSGGTVTVTGAASAGAHSIQCIARHVTGSGASFALGALGSTAFSGTAYARYTSNNITAVGAEVVTFTIPAGVTIRVVLVGLEAGTVATSPIVTAGATAIRYGDVPSTAVMDSVVPLDEHTIFAEAKTYGGATQAVFDYGDTTERHHLYMASPTPIVYGQILKGGVSQCVYATSTANFSSGVVHKVASSIRRNHFQLVMDGSIRDTDTSGETPNVVGFPLWVGVNRLSTLQINGWVRTVTVYPRALEQAELEALTA